MVVKKRAPAAGGSRKKVPAVPAAEQAPESPAASPGKAATKAPAGRTTARRAAEKSTATRGAATRAATGKAATGKAAEKAAAKDTSGRGTAAGKAAAAAGTAGSEPAGAAAGEQAAPRGAGSRAAAGKRAVGKVPPGKAGGEARAARQASAGGDDGKETAVGNVEAEKTEVPVAHAGVEPGALAVLPGEDPWTEEEVAEARDELTDEVARLRAEIESSEAAVAGLMRDSGDGAGDEADTGTKNITREYEMALAANTRETLTQARHALQRLEEGTYGRCEVCGRPIGKARMQAFPRATLCLDDKQKQERR